MRFAYTSLPYTTSIDLQIKQIFGKLQTILYSIRLQEYDDNTTEDNQINETESLNDLSTVSKIEEAIQYTLAQDLS